MSIEIADTQFLGPFPMQHHGVDAQTSKPDNALRLLLHGVRLQIDPEDGVTIEDGTFGQIVGGRLWKEVDQTKYPRVWHHGFGPGAMNKAQKIEAVKGPAWDELEVGLEPAEARTPYDIKLPVGAPVAIGVGFDFEEQNELAAPYYFGIVAPHKDGTAEIGTKVFDLDQGDKVDEDRFAHIQSFFRVWKDFAPIKSKGKKTKAAPGFLAWQIGLGRGGFKGHGVVAEFGDGKNPQQQLGTVSHRLGGPFKTVPKSDQHSYFTSDLAENGAPVHIDTMTIFHGNGGDAPLEFGGEYTPCFPGPLITTSYLRHDSEADHVWAQGSGKGMWRIQGTSFFAWIPPRREYPPHPPGGEDLTPIPRFQPIPRVPPRIEGDRGGVFIGPGQGQLFININIPGPVPPGGPGRRRGPAQGPVFGPGLQDRPGPPPGRPPRTGGGIIGGRGGDPERPGGALELDPLGFDDIRDAAARLEAIRQIELEARAAVDRGDRRGPLLAGARAPRTFLEEALPRDIAGSVTEIAMPALVFRAQHFGERQPDIRNVNAEVFSRDPAALDAWYDQPIVARIEALGPQASGGGWDLTTEPGEGRYIAGGTGAGIITIFPPELGHEQIGLDEAEIDISGVCLNLYSTYSKLTWGTPDAASGLIFDGFGLGLGAGGNLELSCYSEVGAITDVAEFICGGGVAAAGYIEAPAYTESAYNDSGGIITAGTVVYVTGANAGEPTIAPTTGAGDLPHGIAYSLSLNASSTEVIRSGFFSLAGILDTSSAAVGDFVYYTPAGGTLTLTPGGGVAVGIVIIVSVGSGAMLVGPGMGSDVSGPASSTDNAIARWDGTGGNTLQDSGVTIDDSDNLETSGTITGLSAIIEADSSGPATPSGYGSFWVLGNTPSDPRFRDDAGVEFPLFLSPASFGAGDLLVGSATASRPTRLAPTTNGFVLTLSGGAPVWAAASVGLGGSTGANDNRLLRADGVGGSTVQASTVTLSDTDFMSGLQGVSFGEEASAPIVNLAGTGYIWVLDSAPNAPYFTNDVNEDIPLAGWLGREVTEDRAAGSTTSTIPNAGGTPTTSNGAQFLSVSYTPKSASSKLLIRASAQVGSSSANHAVSIALFRPAGSANAIAAASWFPGASLRFGTITAQRTIDSPGTSSLTFTMRMGPTNSATTAYFNAKPSTGAAFFAASVENSYIEVVEYMP